MEGGKGDPEVIEMLSDHAGIGLARLRPAWR